MKNSLKQETAVSIGIIIVSILVLAYIVMMCLRPKQAEEPLPTTAAMPDIVGYSCGEAKIYYRDLFSIEVNGEDFSDEYLEGAILSQSISAGTEYTIGNTLVWVTVSKGAKPEETTAASEAPVTETTAATAETEPEPPPLTDGKIDNPPAEFESAYPDFDLDITAHGFEFPEGRGKEIEKELYNLMRKHGADAGFVYYDPATGGSVEYNADEKFSAGSIIKAIYARSLLGAGIDLSQKYEMTEELLNGPYEYVNGQPVGTEFTAEELIRAAIVRSDNTAYKMLYNYIGYSDFNDYAASLRLPQRMTDDNYWFRMSARHTASYFKDIYFFTEQHVNGELMRECLANTEYREMVSAALPDKSVAEKYGYLPQEEFYTIGDGAIVYGDRPYILVIYVRGTGTDLNTKFFRDTAALVDELHELSE